MMITTITLTNTDTGTTERIVTRMTEATTTVERNRMTDEAEVQEDIPVGEAVVVDHPHLLVVTIPPQPHRKPPTDLSRLENVAPVLKLPLQVTTPNARRYEAVHFLIRILSPVNKVPYH